SYSVSHDLRAPLRAVHGYSQILEEDYAASMDVEARRLLGEVRGAATRMDNLIDDLLAFSRASRQPLQTVLVNMRRLVREVLSEVATGYPSATIEVLDLPEASGTPALLKQVWINLIGNALKYSSKNPAPRVEIGGRRNAAEIEYWVRDNGVGFNPRYMDKLFGVFQRLHDAKDFPGTGVGLALSQRIVARHNGRMWAETQPSEGASFYFSLPVAAPL
ncbi:MAG: sensor histidine kinase, partial [Burkholderiales bacterium]